MLKGASELRTLTAHSKSICCGRRRKLSRMVLLFGSFATGKQQGKNTVIDPPSCRRWDSCQSDHIHSIFRGQLGPNLDICHRLESFGSTETDSHAHFATSTSSEVSKC